MPAQSWWLSAPMIGGWVLATAGLALLVWALRWDRSRGRRRCPTCWYDMSGAPAPGLRCPECGREARREAMLFRTRRNRWLAALGCIVILAAGGMGVVGLGQGWAKVAPTWLLLAWRKQMYPPLHYSQQQALPAWVTAATDELHRRYAAGAVSDWEWKKIVRADPRYHRLAGKAILSCRDRWPAGTPLWVEVKARGRGTVHARELRIKPLFVGGSSAVFGLGDSQSWIQDAPRPERGVVVGVPPQGNGGLSFRVELVELIDPGRELVVWWTVENLPVAIGGTVNEIITPVDSEDVNRRMQADHQLRLDPSRGALLGTPRMSRSPMFCATPIVVEIQYGNQLVLRAEGAPDEWFGLRSVVGSVDDAVQGELIHGDLDDPRWVVTVRGDGELALRDFRLKEYWAGEYTTRFADICPQCPRRSPPSPAEARPPGGHGDSVK